VAIFLECHGVSAARQRIGNPDEVLRLLRLDPLWRDALIDRPLALGLGRAHHELAGRDHHQLRAPRRVNVAKHGARFEWQCAILPETGALLDPEFSHLSSLTYRVHLSAE
jgi:hypothetical protein